MNTFVLTFIVCAVAGFCIVAPIILTKQAEREAKRQAQQQAEDERKQTEARRREAERKANDPAEIARKQREQQAAAQRALEAAQQRAETVKRGEKPVPSAWDGLTPEVADYLRSILKDYDSMKLVECSVIARWGDYAWCQRVKYRAKNSFGAYELEEQVFVIRNGRVIDVFDY